jgi:hypothetical protein
MFLASAVSHAFRVVRNSKRLLVVAGFADLLVCLPAAMYVLHRVHAEAGQRVDALDLAKRYDPDFMADLRNHAPGLDDDLMWLTVGCLALFFMLRPLVVGAFVSLAATRRRMRLPEILRESASTYWKFLRLSVFELVAVFLLAIATKPLLAQVAEWAGLRSEPTANKYRLITNLVVYGAFCVVAIVFDYARVGVRVERRPGVLGELGRAALFVLQHPARTFALFVASLAMEVGVVYGLGYFVQIADGGYFTTSIVVLVLVQLVVTLREAARLFHVAGAWHVRSSEAGDEARAGQPIRPDEPDSDVLRSPLPWNVR